MGTEVWNVDCSFRWFRSIGEFYVKVPFLGAVSYLTLAICPFCIVSAVIWAVYRQYSFAWIGQDILVSTAPLSLLTYFILYTFIHVYELMLHFFLGNRESR